MTAIRFDVDDPYAVHPLCGHVRSADTTIVKSNGDIVPPFTMTPYGSDRKKSEPIYFVGEVYQEIQWEGYDTDGYQIAQLDIVKFHMAAEHPQFGIIDITLDSTRPGNLARLRSVSPGKKYPVVHRTELHAIATVSTSPGLILQNAGPAMKFVSDELSVWPPENNIYELATLVDFEVRGSKGQVVMTANEGGTLVSKVSRG